MITPVTSSAPRFTWYADGPNGSWITISVPYDKEMTEKENFNRECRELLKDVIDRI